MEGWAVKSKCIDLKAERKETGARKGSRGWMPRFFFEIFSKNCWIIQKKRIFAEKYGMKRNKTKLK